MKAELHQSHELSPTGFSAVTAGNNKKLTVVKENKYMQVGGKISIKRIQSLAMSICWREVENYNPDNHFQILYSEKFQNRWIEILTELLSYVERKK